VIDSEVSYQSKFVSVLDDTVILPNGQETTFTRVELKDYVTILPFLEDKILMIEIFRYPRNCLNLELPSGQIEEGESPKESAFRELEEETGYRAGKLESIGFFHPLSRSTQKAHLFLANELKEGERKLDMTEQINVKFYSIKEIRKMLSAGKLTHAPTLVALQKFMLMNINGY
jgi:ADP-ribose pyrophosphatase